MNCPRCGSHAERLAEVYEDGGFFQCENEKCIVAGYRVSLNMELLERIAISEALKTEI